MTEFGATLQAFIERHPFEHQSAFAEAAAVSDSTITRAIRGRSFSWELLAKLIKPFPPAKQIELVRAYIRDGLASGASPPLVAQRALGNDTDSLARFAPATRLLALEIAASIEEDPAFQTTLENLLQLLQQSPGARGLAAVAEPRGNRRSSGNA